MKGKGREGKGTVAHEGGKRERGGRRREGRMNEAKTETANNTQRLQKGQSDRQKLRENIDGEKKRKGAIDLRCCWWRWWSVNGRILWEG
jgi:hypothetical protein